ncbi:hypothetical protein XU18_4732 [Perkinsela sp. CCAP 1560/4]|nr:hypothetical protein XU18_4732 [Perkinsela sp. CCAP 1560/4]|eukprot:KNH03924.1 hypothetical protein XU18_4732 [Perkinsela sp. CCAP 1560/4]
MIKKFIDEGLKSRLVHQLRGNADISSAYYEAIQRIRNSQKQTAPGRQRDRVTEDGPNAHTKTAIPSSRKSRLSKHRRPQVEKKSLTCAEEKFEKKLSTMLQYPAKHTWREFLSMSQVTSVPYVLHVLWRHKQRHARKPSIFEPLPQFPYSFFFQSLCWVLRAMRTLIDPSQEAKMQTEYIVTQRYTHVLTLLIRKIGYTISKRDPHEYLVYSSAVNIDGALKGSARWTVATMFVERLLQAYTATNVHVNLMEDTKVTRAVEATSSHREWNMVLYNSLDILIPTMLKNWGAFLGPSKTYSVVNYAQGELSFGHSVLGLFACARRHNFRLLWDPFGTSVEDRPTACGSCMDDAYQQNATETFLTPCVMHRNLDFLDLGIRNLLPFAAVLQVLVEKYKIGKQQTFSQDAQYSLLSQLANDLVEFYESLAHKCPKRKSHNGQPEAETFGIVALDEFLIVSLESILKEIPDAWFVYVRVMERVFHVTGLSRYVMAAWEKPFPSVNQRIEPQWKVQFCQDETSYLVQDLSLVRSIPKVHGIWDWPQRNLILFSNKDIARQYQNALGLLLDGVISHLSWHGYKILRLQNDSTAAHWMVACSLIRKVHERMNRVAFWSNTISNLNCAGCNVYRLLPPSSRRWTLQNAFKLLTAARKFGEIRNLYWAHVQVQERATIGAYLENLTEDLQTHHNDDNRPYPNVYISLLQAQIRNITRLRGMSIALLACCFGPSLEKNDNWLAIATPGSPKTPFTALHSVSFLASSFNEDIDATEVNQASPFKGVRLITHSFPLHYFLQILLPRHLFSEIVSHSIRKHGTVLSLEEATSSLRLMNESHCCWKDTLHLYTFSVLPKISVPREVSLPILKKIFSLHTELFESFFSDVSCPFHISHDGEDSPDKISSGPSVDNLFRTKEHLFTFFLVFRYFAHFITLSIRGETKGVGVFHSIQRDEGFLSQSLTQRAAHVIMKMISHLLRTYFVGVPELYLEGEEIVRATYYNDLFGDSPPLGVSKKTTHLLAVQDRKHFTPFFLRYVGMMMTQCLKHLHLSRQVKSKQKG